MNDTLLSLAATTALSFHIFVDDLLSLETALESLCVSDDAWCWTFHFIRKSLACCQNFSKRFSEFAQKSRKSFSIFNWKISPSAEFCTTSDFHFLFGIMWFQAQRKPTCSINNSLLFLYRRYKIYCYIYIGINLFHL